MLLKLLAGSFLASVLAIFSQFTWKCTKKKTKYALFQIETEFDCLLKTEYSITALETVWIVWKLFIRR